MANPDHLAILKQGVPAWNKWRGDHPKVRGDFKKASFFEAPLRMCDFRLCDLRGCNFDHADLKHSSFRRAKLGGASFHETNLSDVDLADADLSTLDLSVALFAHTNLCNAKLSAAGLWGARFISTQLAGTDFSNAHIGYAQFDDVDLSLAVRLDCIEFRGPCTLGFDTIIRSNNRIPITFLRGCGLPQQLITYLPTLLKQPIEFYSCFISYSTKNQEFADRV
jgi:hypothetical protein